MLDKGVSITGQVVTCWTQMLDKGVSAYRHARALQALMVMAAFSSGLNSLASLVGGFFLPFLSFLPILLRLFLLFLFHLGLQLELPELSASSLRRPSH
jgi:hypothetical protein